jgi:hypothetical protein
LNKESPGNDPAKGEGKEAGAPTKKANEPPAWVKEAVDNGVKFLRKTVKDGGGWAKTPRPTGYAALTGLALLEAGVPPNDPLFAAARGEILSRWRPLQATYELALAIMFLDRLGNIEDEAVIRTLALRLVAGQNPDGGWTYNCPLLPDPVERQLLEFLRTNRLKLQDLTRPKEFTHYIPDEADRPVPPRPKPVQAPLRPEQLPPEVRGLPVVQQPKTTPGQPPASAGNRSDNSNSQFAMLGLWIAQRYDVPMERTLNLVDQRYRQTQSAAGAWSYVFADPNVTPPMTCAGLLGLAVGHGSAQQVTLGDQAKPAKKSGSTPSLQDAAIQKGLKYLGENIGQPSPKPNVYYLWSVERVAVVYHLNTIGGKDWYSWGAKMLLASQEEDGHWSNGIYFGSNATLDTCFSLLFLTKANFVPGLTEDLQEYIKVQDPG